MKYIDFPLGFIMFNQSDIVQDIHAIIRKIICNHVDIPEFVSGSGIYGLEILHNVVDLGCVMVDHVGQLKLVNINMLRMVSPEIGVNNSLNMEDLDVGLDYMVILFASLVKQLSESKLVNV